MPGRSPRDDRPRRDDGHLRQRRQRVAIEAARLLATRAASDLDDARRRAMRQLGEDAREALPDADQVRDELRAYLRLFHGEAQPATLQALRRAALEAMTFLSAFPPRLVGAVLDGTADAGAPVQLQLFSDDPDALPRFLEDHGIPARAVERRLRLPGGASTRRPAWTVEADGVVVELLPLPIELLHQALPGDDPGTVLHRANAAAVRALLETETGPGPTRRPG
jgi:hypothetical protein